MPEAPVQAKSYVHWSLAIGTSILVAQLGHNQHLLCLLLLTKRTLGEEEAPRDNRKAEGKRNRKLQIGTGICIVVTKVTRTAS